MYVDEIQLLQVRVQWWILM